MILQPCAPWLILTLAVVLLGDALLMLRPPAFIVTCLTGVGFPREWWWALIVIKILAAAGLVVGLRVPGVAAAEAPVLGPFLERVYAMLESGLARLRLGDDARAPLGAVLPLSPARVVLDVVDLARELHEAARTRPERGASTAERRRRR